MQHLPVIGIVLPCYNEADALPQTFPRINDFLSKMIRENIISEKSFAVFVDDGSTDDTWQQIKAEASVGKNIKGLKLSANVGHQKALLAGLNTFVDEADAIITADVDLQDDIDVMKEMVLKFSCGANVVYGVRRGRKSDTRFKRKTAFMFYKLMKLMKVNIIHNHADFRLCSRRVLKALGEFGEVNLFLRGIIPSIGYKSDVVYYDRGKRCGGSSKYPFRKMTMFAWDGITSFSNYPLKLVTIIGFVVFLLCIAFSIYALASMLLGNTVPGWLSTVLPMYFLGGIQLLCLGIAGEYIGKIYMEVKKRPRYFIDEKID